MNRSPESLVAIGRVVKAHGIRGEVVVHPLSDVEGRFDAGRRVHLDGRAIEIVSSRPHQGRLLVGFAGVADRTSAELLRGRLVEAEPVDLDESETWFVHELVGVPVRHADGRDLGVVAAAVELPDAAGYDLLEVRRADGSTWLLPAVEDYVEVVVADESVDHLVVVDPPEGLVDGTAAEADPA